VVPSQAPNNNNNNNNNNTNMPMLSLPPPQQPTAASVYADPNLRLPVPQLQAAAAAAAAAVAGPPPHTMPPHGQPPPAVGPPRQTTTDGLGLLIEAFDTHHTPGTAPMPPGTTAPPSGPVYDPSHVSGPPPPQYYPQPALAINDGYEHELGYYMSDGVPPVMQQSWATGGDMYGY